MVRFLIILDILVFKEWSIGTHWGWTKASAPLLPAGGRPVVVVNSGDRLPVEVHSPLGKTMSGANL